MSNIPKNRSHLIELIEGNFAKLSVELDTLTNEDAQLIVEEDISIKDILAVRLWWCEATLMWISVGRDGGTCELPAEEYSWQQTPALNKHIAEQAVTVSIEDLIGDLKQGVKEVLRVIDTLTEAELCDVGMFKWAGKWPVMRWVSVNTSSQFDSARKMIRRAKRAKNV
ncbi:ClbS/DfsB family four-helix bundle protein [Curvivirga sp.]|uniref:ClbS/DfsB family four-helix bundle protein n=1 Tax=Curvivirga sp. TaxID=2856848 RepID=UPI003B5BA549